jgi:hypothetical protein
MSGFGVPVRVEGVTDISQGLINIQRSLSDLFQKIGDISTNVTGVLGTTTNDSAAAGYVGEFISSSIPLGSAVAAASTASVNVTSISLTAGDWDVWGNVVSAPTGAVVTTFFQAWLSTVSATPPTFPNSGAYAAAGPNNTASQILALPTGTMRLSLAATTTVYLSTNLIWTGGTGMAAYGFIGARRRR